MADSPCSIDGCESPRLTREMCQKHYMAWKRANAKEGITIPDGRRKPARACAVADCMDRAASKGMCRRHYLRNYRHGTVEPPTPRAPSTAAARPSGAADCAVSGCSNHVRARGFCLKHYKAFRKHGTPTPRKLGEVVDGKRICPRCKVDGPASEVRGSYCPDCSRALQRERKAKDYVPAPTTAVACVVCGSGFQGTKRQWATCSEACILAYKARRDSEYQKAHRENAREANRRWRKANPEKLAEKERRRNARKRGATIGPIDLDALWTGFCGICSEVMSADLRHPDLMSRSLDHIQPLAKGGAHTQENVQWAHLICNVRKGDRVVSEVA